MKDQFPKFRKFLCYVKNYSFLKKILQPYLEGFIVISSYLHVHILNYFFTVIFPNKIL